MAPKKKGANKKGGDDWEAELGESIAPAAAASPTTDAPADDEETSAGGGGLMNLMRKNKEKRKKKGLADDFPEDEGASAGADDAPTTFPDLSAKQAVEANAEDEFALPEKKGKGGKGKQQQQQKPAAADEDVDESGRVLTKAEKEKLKKEREKQRKKEQVGLFVSLRDSRNKRLTSG